MEQVESRHQLMYASDKPTRFYKHGAIEGIKSFDADSSLGFRNFIEMILGVLSFFGIFALGIWGVRIYVIMKATHPAAHRTVTAISMIIFCIAIAVACLFMVGSSVKRLRDELKQEIVSAVPDALR
jgi:amino acid transporter